ncbi:GntR family transcriptional regulator [Ferrovibrio sp.]|uniref:FadR/GntR family transcriptional regulator n=1 Tax=Ferrovibrio sp. TaxID=1917215 RepID=UPI000CBF9903|nr:GntR family transcriptional regulator [Ferrovibrio sp.]PJI42238.1 MAG: GntR family transcriptional regulator [Ferrovibrio sp.]
MDKNLSSFIPVKGRRAYEDIAANIREMVVDGRLKPGEKLPPEREFAEHLGVGRNVLREALRSLETIGLIEMRRGKWGGAFVASRPSRVVAEQMTDLLRMGGVSYASVIEARIWIGSVVVRAACVRHTEDDIEALERNIEEVERLFDEGRMVEKTFKNIEFHNLLAAATKNPTLTILMKSLTDMAAYFARNIGPDPASTTVRSRRLFMKAFVARDVEAAVKEMEASLLRLHTVHVDLATKKGAKPVPTSGAASPAPTRAKPAPKSSRSKTDTAR